MIAAIANTFSNCFKIPELKSRILFTLVVLAICRLEAVVRIPGLNGSALAQFFESHRFWQRRLRASLSRRDGASLSRCGREQIAIRPALKAKLALSTDVPVWS